VGAVSERYIAKSNPSIISCIYTKHARRYKQNIELEPENTYLSHRIKLDYRYGLNKIYSIEDMERAKKSHSVDREYDLKYLGKIGNLYSQLSIQNTIEKGKQFDPDNINPNTDKYICIDPAF
jgi:hypothetical protein